MNKKKLFFIVFSTPPCNEVDSLRSSKIAKYLHEGGTEVIIFSVHEDYYNAGDSSRISDISGIRVIRTGLFPKIPFCADPGLRWIFPLFLKLFQKIITEKPDALYFSGGPFFQLIIAPVLKKLFKIPFILDFRDPWYLNPNRSHAGIRKFFSQVIRLMESFCISHASYVINVNEECSTLYKNHYGHSSKFITVPNGYDQSDFSDITPVRFSDFDIVYSGKFGPHRDPEPFFSALHLFITDKKLSPESIRFVWAGEPETKITDLLNKYQLSGFSVLTGYLPYRKSLELISGSRACLLVTGSHSFEGTTKIFDYLALEKPVIALSENRGTLRNILEKAGNIPCRNSEEIYQLLDSIYHSSNPDLAAPQLFSRKESAKIIQSLLENLC